MSEEQKVGSHILLMRWILIGSSWLAATAVLGLLLAGLMQIAHAVGYALDLLDFGDQYPTAAVAGIKPH